MGQNFSASASDSDKFLAIISCFLSRKSWRIRSISCSEAICPMTHEDWEAEEDSWATVLSYGLACSNTHRPPNKTAANMPVDKFAFTTILLEPAQTSAGPKVFRTAIH